MAAAFMYYYVFLAAWCFTEYCLEDFVFHFP